MTLSSVGNLGIYGNFLSGSDFVGLGLQLPSSRVCNDDDKNLIVTRDNGNTIGKIYDSVYNPPPSLAGLALANNQLEFQGYQVYTSAAAQAPTTYNLSSSLPIGGGPLGSYTVLSDPGSVTYTQICVGQTTDGVFSKYFNEVAGFKIHFELNISSGTFAFSQSNYTALQLNIVDDQGHSIMNNANCAIQFVNTGFTYDALTKILTFDYYIDSYSSTVQNSITAYIYGQDALTNVNSATNFKIQYKVFSNNNTVIPVASSVQNAYCTIYGSDASFTYPLASKTDGITTSINLGDNVPLLLATREDLSYNGTSLLPPVNTNTGSISRTFTALPSTPDNFFIPVGANTAGCVKITLVGHTVGTGEIFKGWGCFEVMCCYNNASTPSNYTGTALPYLNSATGQIINGSDVNGDTNSCVFQASSVSMSTAHPNQISVFVSFHTSNVVYTAKYEITSCIGTP